jgi:hypothetical protein
MSEYCYFLVKKNKTKQPILFIFYKRFKPI